MKPDPLGSDMGRSIGGQARRNLPASAVASDTAEELLLDDKNRKSCCLTIEPIPPTPIES